MRRLLLLAAGILVFSNPASASAPWVHGDWQYRVPFQANPAQVEGTDSFNDFGLLVVLDGVNHADIFANAKTDGSDLLFTTQNGAVILEREIVSYDNVGQTAEIWVRVPSFSKTENEFFVYYDNAAANLDPSPATAWSSEYRAIYHFEDDPTGLVLTDSSPQGVDVFLNASRGWTTDMIEPGAIGRGWHLNGDTHHMASSAISTTIESYAISGWITNDYVSSDFFTQANPDFWHVSSQVGPNAERPDYAGPGYFIRWEPEPVPLLDDHHHFLWEFDADADTVIFYFDGVPQDPFLTFPSDRLPFYSGRLINPNQNEPVGVVGPMFYVPADLHSGSADEFRIREGVMGADRILTEFRNQDDPESFFTFDAAEIQGATGVPLASNGTLLQLRSYPNPSSGRTSIAYSLPQEGPVRISVYDLGGRRVATVVQENRPAGRWEANWDGLGSRGEPIANGVYFLRLETPYGVTSRKLTLVR